MEARIRREKVELAGYRTAAENAEDGVLRAVLEDKASAVAARLQRHHQQYYKFCEENDLKPLNDRLYAAKRSQAAAPAAAMRSATTPDAMFSSARGSGGDAAQPGETIHRYLGKVDLADTEQVEDLKNVFCERYASSPVENMMVITKNGEIHFMTDNNPARVDCSYLGDKLEGSYNIHTHPPNTTQYSFSTDTDIPAAFSDGTAIMEAVDYKYRYRFVVPKDITLDQWEDVRMQAEAMLPAVLESLCKPDYSDYKELKQHTLISEICKILGINCYSRWKT